ncbi:MAG: DUF6212 domain-containing protein [Pseudomonadota bacterium]
MTVVRFGEWRASLVTLGEGDGDARLILADQVVLGLLLTEEEAAALAADAPLAELLKSAEIPVVSLAPGSDALKVADAAMALLVARHQTVAHQGAQDRAALAALRVSHMQMQDDHAELEAWVWEALAPTHKLARQWPATSEAVDLAPEAELIQPLPVPARGFIAVDVHVAESPVAPVTLEAQVRHPAGPPVEGADLTLTVSERHAGWLRLSLPKAPGGPPADAELVIQHESGPALRLSRAPESPFPDLCLQGQSAPLALKVYQTLPRMPAPPVHQPGQPVPADGVTRLVRPSDLGPIERLPYWAGKVPRRLRAYPDYVRAEFWEKEDAHFVHPSAHRPVVAKVSGLKVEGLVQASAVTQIWRHDTLPISFALGIAPAGQVTTAEEALAHLGDWVQLLPAAWGEVWCEPLEALTGEVDLLLATAMPDMPFNRNADALFHAYRITCR